MPYYTKANIYLNNISNNNGANSENLSSTASESHVIPIDNEWVYFTSKDGYEFLKNHHKIYRK